MRKIITLIAASAIMAGCSSIDCPFNNRVYASYKLIGDITSTPATFTVSTPLSEAEGNDSVLINMISETDSISLPMSYSRPTDTFYFTINKEDGQSTTDTIRVSKNDIPHFESIDCSPVYFHDITSVEHTSHGIESIMINNNKVTYHAAKANINIYLKNDNN